MKISSLNYIFLFSTFLLMISPRVYSNVLQLDEENFEDVLEKHKFVLVNFYAPWCKFCKDFSVVFTATARKINELGAAVTLAKIDATAEKSLAKKYKINGYPTLVFFRNGQPADKYAGVRTTKNIIAWVLEKVPVKTQSK